MKALFTLRALLVEAVLGAYLAGMGWLLLSNPRVLLVYGGLGAVMTVIAYALWRGRKRAAKEASRQVRVRLDLDRP